MPKIVLSYRRSDSDAIAGRIRDRLANHYGNDAVFMDIDSIPFGTDFRAHIRSALAASDIVVAIIGPRWLGPLPDGGSRIKDATDPVRIELETALEGGLRVIPVLVDHAVMPKPADLPDALQVFAYHNAAEVNAGRDFHPHMDRLIRGMDQMLGRGTRGWPGITRRQAIIAGAAAAVLMLIGMLWFAGGQLRQPPAATSTAPPPIRTAVDETPARPPPVPAAARTIASVRSAIYGGNCPFNPDDKGKLDVTSFIAEFCKREPSEFCRYPVQREVIGDPSRGCAKSLRVRYACVTGNTTVMKEHLVEPEASGRYALMQCAGAIGAIRSTLEQDSDRSGSDYHSFPLDKGEPQSCAQACLDDARCRAWTYVKAGVQGPAAMCWLKSDVPVAAKRDCCVSGIIR